ncbi:hypothetical protein ACPYO6_12515 [Georgenia sp. Z1344]|uniref:hypothetical protein n=1 Tax=Georgenia sp. Z1344 TaxID=3416706 RepID=UPI003CF8BDA9
MATEYSGTVAEYYGELVECMADRGWDSRVEIDPQYGRIMATDSGRGRSDAALSDDTFACTGTLAAAPVLDSPERYREIYPIRVERYECMVDADFQPDPPPSIETFVESGMGESRAWEPVSGLSVGEAMRAAEACPVDPDQWLY